MIKAHGEVQEWLAKRSEIVSMLALKAMSKRRSGTTWSDTGRSQKYPCKSMLEWQECGEVQEWLNWPLSKSGVPQGTEGSNPSLSAMKKRRPSGRRFFIPRLEPSGFCPSKNNRGFGGVQRNSGKVYFCQNEQTKEQTCLRYPSLERKQRQLFSFANERKRALARYPSGMVQQNLGKVSYDALEKYSSCRLIAARANFLDFSL
jgi:hypothetical protein